MSKHKQKMIDGIHALEGHPQIIRDRLLKIVNEFDWVAGTYENATVSEFLYMTMIDKKYISSVTACALFNAAMA